ncbi:MAG: helix-turn-helix transcriptional regulator [Pseudomonas sp.]|nr:helix-turn-helix transcriptional regulator [Pseudomonas sp.]
MKIGVAIRKIRLERGLTLEQVAFDADTYAGNLSKIERDQHLPSLDLLHKIAQALSIRMSELYAIAESDSKSSEKLMQEDHTDYANEVILMRRHFQTLTPANRDLAIELIKVLMRTQSAEP